ncbi:MAG: hypothetical protein KF773_07275 [Deltaproteobacteria bacterium]|nr:hypothetical protein [Deltaproteobacteria bacterium]
MSARTSGHQVGGKVDRKGNMRSGEDEFGARLRAAFPAEPLDFNEALTGGTDGGKFRNAVDGKPWTELDQTLIGSRSDVLSFLEPAHFVAVLPAFLQALVEKGTATGVHDTLMVVLDREQEPRFDKIASRMTDEQRVLVAEALELFAASTTGGQASTARQVIDSWRTQ